jgi:preprotein translocase subunit SecD
MTAAKTGLLSAGLVGVFVLGVMTGPTVRDNWSKMKAPEAAVAAPSVEPSAPAPVKADRPAPRAKSSSSRVQEAVTTKKPANAIQRIEVSMWEPETRDRVKAVLNRGSRLEIAAADFDSSEQFVTVAHAARNTNVPFVVLKDRVVNQGQSLADAIREFKPELDAKAEVKRARAAAQSDLGIAS